MKIRKISLARILAGALLVPIIAFGLTACGSANSQTSGSTGTPTTSLQPNQTMGFSDGNLVKFTYTQNFDCVDQASDDLNYDGKPAESNPAEMQTPICQAAIQPTMDPTGANATNTAVLFVLVPMFSVNNDQNPADAIACNPKLFRPGTLCGPTLGKTLIKLFGAIPEAYKEKPAVFTDCPNPGSPPGSCTMHAATVDLGKALVALGKLPAPAANVFLPTPNHSHVIANNLAETKAIWWEVKPVLVTNENYWPPKGGGSGITSVASLQAAEKAGVAIVVPSNFFLFFSSQAMNPMMNAMSTGG